MIRFFNSYIKLFVPIILFTTIYIQAIVCTSCLAFVKIEFKYLQNPLVRGSVLNILLSRNTELYVVRKYLLLQSHLTQSYFLFQVSYNVVN